MSALTRSNSWSPIAFTGNRSNLLPAIASPTRLIQPMALPCPAQTGTLVTPCPRTQTRTPKPQRFRILHTTKYNPPSYNINYESQSISSYQRSPTHFVRAPVAASTVPMARMVVCAYHAPCLFFRAANVVANAWVAIGSHGHVALQIWPRMGFRLV
jgi:hypothetical protein